MTQRYQSNIRPATISLWIAFLLISVLLINPSVFAGPGGASQANLQGHTITASHTLKIRAHVEDAAIEISRLIFDLAHEYSSATSINVQLKMDVSGSEDQSLSRMGTVEFDRLVLDDLAQVRQCSSFQELLYNSYVWLPARLQTRLDRLLKSSGG